MSCKNTKINCLLLFLFFSMINLNCDSWVKPSKMIYDSPNKKYTFITKPSFSVFFKLIKCKGKLYKNTNNGKKQKIWSQNLVNDSSPYGALIHNEGKFVVTFNDYPFLGYGKNVVVIYDKNGAVINKLSLNDFIEFEDKVKLKHSVSSIWWMGNHLIAEQYDVLILEIPFFYETSQRDTSLTLYGAGDKPKEYSYILIDLETGKLIDKFQSSIKLSEEQVIVKMK